MELLKCKYLGEKTFGYREVPKGIEAIRECLAPGDPVPTLTEQFDYYGETLDRCKAATFGNQRECLAWKASEDIF